MPRQSGTRNRNYPSLTLEQSLPLAAALADQASGMTVDKLTLAQLMQSTPGSSTFKELLLASRAYGLTEGGVNASQFSLTELGADVASEDESARTLALKQAVMNIKPFRAFLEQFHGKKVPVSAVAISFLTTSAGVPSEWGKDCIDHLLADARFAQLLRGIKNSEYVDIKTTAPISPNGRDLDEDETVDEYDDSQAEIPDDEEFAQQPFSRRESERPAVPQKKKPMKVFVAHGRSEPPLVELREVLTELGIPHVIVKDQAHAGRPISEQVQTAMRDECSSAICIFSADEQFFQKDSKGEMIEVWRPSQNAIYELGAASVLYGRRVILFKEDKVNLPSDFSDIGHITFSSGAIKSHMYELLRELQAHEIIQMIVTSQ